MHIPIRDPKSVPELGEFFIKVEIEADFVLHFDTLLDGRHIYVCLKPHRLKLLLKLFNSAHNTSIIAIRIDLDYHTTFHQLR